MEKKKRKKFYIKDVEKILGVKRSTLFVWERENKIPKAKREKMSGYRYWSKAEIERIRKMAGL